MIIRNRLYKLGIEPTPLWLWVRCYTLGLVTWYKWTYKHYVWVHYDRAIISNQRRLDKIWSSITGIMNEDEAMANDTNPRMTNISAIGRFGRVYNKRHQTCLTDSRRSMVMRNWLQICVLYWRLKILHNSPSQPWRPERVNRPIKQ